MTKLTNEDNENFLPDEYVDIINSKKSYSYEGKIIAIKGDKIIVENLSKHKEESINRSDKRILKQWNPGEPIKKFNRVDLRLKGTEYWVEGVVIDIKHHHPYNQLLIRYRNNNIFKPYVEELIYEDDNRITKIGLYTKDANNKKLSSTFFNLEESKIDNSEINLDNVKILNNKRKRPDENNFSLKDEEDEEEIKFKILLFQNNLVLREVLGDGNCMFRAVSDQVYGTDEHHQIIREKCMDYLVIFRKYFEPYIDEDFDDYIKEKRKNKTWGDDVELEALSEIYNRPIEIYKESNKPLKTFHEKIYEQDKDINNYSMTPIRLSYHKKNHYNSIIPLESDKINYRNYRNGLIKAKPGVYETKILKQARENEEEFDKGIKLSKHYSERIKQNLTNRVEDLSNINNINTKEEDNKKIIKKKDEEDVVKNKENIEKSNEVKNIVNYDDKVKDKEKSKEKEKEKDNEDQKNIDKNDDNIDPDYYLSNPTIKFAVESGFPLIDAIEAWSIFYDDKESVIDYLLNKKNYLI